MSYYRDKIERAAEIIRICNENNIEPVSTANADLANRLREVYGLTQLYASPVAEEPSELRAVLEAETPEQLEDALRAYIITLVLQARAEVNAWAALQEEELVEE